jgi:exonuclease SbcC
LRKVGTDINKHAPDKGCVLSKDIPCKTEAEAFKGHLRGLKTQADAFKRDIAESQGVIEGLSAQLTDEAAQDKELAGLMAMFTERGKAAVVVAKATFDVSQAERELTDCPEKTANSADLQTVRERIRKGEGLVLEARDLLRQRIEHEDKTKQREAAAEKLQALESRVELLGPKGARVGALGSALEAFQHDINYALDEFGYVLAFSVDPWGVNVSGRDSALLSSSERLRVGLCFALALAKVTGINFVALDAADMLDAQGRGVLMEVLTNVEGVQVVVAATRETELPSMEGLASYWLEREDANSPTVVRRT